MAQLYGAAEQPSWEAAGLGSIPLLLITVCECTGKLIPTEDHIESYSQISILLGFQLSLGPLGPPPCLHNFPARREYMKNFSASLWHSFTSRASSPITFLAGLQLTPTKNEILGQQSHRFSSFLQPAKPQVHTHTHTHACAKWSQSFQASKCSFSWPAPHFPGSLSWQRARSSSGRGGHTPLLLLSKIQQVFKNKSFCLSSAVGQFAVL